MKTVKVTVKWKHGFKHSYDYDHATPQRIEELKKHYDGLTWVESVEIKEK